MLWWQLSVRVDLETTFSRKLINKKYYKTHSRSINLLKNKVRYRHSHWATPGYHDPKPPSGIELTCYVCVNTSPVHFPGPLCAGVPVSTQWRSAGHTYPIQIAQFGLSHYCKMLVEGSPKRSVALCNHDFDGILVWEVLTLLTSVRNETNLSWLF